MKNLKRNIKILVVLCFLPLLAGCAAGSATAAYAVKAREADYLSAEGEMRVTNRVKREMAAEFYQQPVFLSVPSSVDQ